jgi:hypothetical protein
MRDAIAAVNLDGSNPERVEPTQYPRRTGLVGRRAGSAERARITSNLREYRNGRNATQ